MKFKDRKTGIVYSTIKQASVAFCSNVPVKGFCHLANKPTCPIYNAKDKDESCATFIRNNPVMAATLMGMIPIAAIDDPCDKEPLICKALGVHVEEEFYIKSYTPFVIKIDSDGNIRNEFNEVVDSQSIIISDVLTAINDPSLIVKVTPMTEAEIDICKTIGASYVTKDDSTTYVKLWANYPYYSKKDNVFFSTDKLLATVHEKLFPSIQYRQRQKV